MIGTILGGIGALGSLYSAVRGNQATKGAFRPYDIGAMEDRLAPLNQAYQNIAGQAGGVFNRAGEMFTQGQELYTQGQEYLDPGSQQNQLMRRNIMDQNLDAIAMSHNLAQRNQYGAPSGLSQAALAGAAHRAIGGAQQNFLQGLAQNRQFGSGLLGQATGMQSGALGQQMSALGQQMSATQGQTGLLENILQGQIANTDIQRQRSAQQAGMWGNISGGLLQVVPNLLGIGG